MSSDRKIRCAVTVSLVPESRGGPFVFWGDLEGSCTKAAEFGFEGVEIFPTHADDLDGHALRGLLERHGLCLAAMGSGAGWVRRKLRLTDPDPHIRICARDFIGAIVDFAGGFGAPAIVGSMQGRWGDGVTREQALGWLAEELEQLGPRANALGVPLLYEPLNRYESNLFNTVDDALEFLKSLQTRNVKLLCDLYHMNIEEADVAGALRSAGDRLGHIHFVDSNRRAIGFGHTDVAPIAAALKETGFSGFVSAEALPLPDSETAARQTITAFRTHFR